MQIEIYKPAQGETIQPVQWNFEELRNQIQEGLKKYTGIVYTEKDIPMAKQNRADLNRLLKAINDKRIEMKKQFLEPYAQFEAECKILTGLIDEQSEKIDEQIKAYENAEKEQKQADILAIYNEVMGDLKELVPYEAIHDKKWLNKGVSLAKIREAIEEVVSKTETAFNAINAMGFDETMTNRIKGAYLRRFDLADAMMEKAKIEEEQRMLAEYEVRKAAEKSRKPSSDRENAVEGNNPPEEKNPSDAKIEAQKDEPVYQLDFRVYVTASQMQALKAFLKTNGIRYGKVE